MCVGKQEVRVSYWQECASLLAFCMAHLALLFVSNAFQSDATRNSVQWRLRDAQRCSSPLFSVTLWDLLWRGIVIMGRSMATPGICS